MKYPAIDSLEKEWAEYPVFHLDFNGKNFTSPLELNETIETFISKSEEKYGKDPFAVTYGDRISYVFEKAHEKTGRRVVVLVDEYDKPLLDVMNTGIPSPVVEGEVKTLEDYNRNILKGFYSVFKLNSTAEIALRQIDEKGYALPYAADKRKIYKVGVSFSSETGTVNDFDYSPRQ